MNSVHFSIKIVMKVYGCVLSVRTNNSIVCGGQRSLSKVFVKLKSACESWQCFHGKQKSCVIARRWRIRFSFPEHFPPNNWKDIGWRLFNLGKYYCFSIFDDLQTLNQQTAICLSIANVKRKIAGSLKYTNLYMFKSNGVILWIFFNKKVFIFKH